MYLIITRRNRFIEENKGQTKTYEIALSGVFLALSVVFLFFASIVPGIELTILALSGVLIMIFVNEVNIKGGVLLYVASLLLSFLIVPNKSILLMYGFIFGPYSIIKAAIERYVNSRVLQYVLKILMFNLLLGAGFLIFKAAFFTGVNLPDFAWYILLAGAQAMLILYDFILTYVVRFYEQIIPKRIRKKGTF